MADLVPVTGPPGPPLSDTPANVVVGPGRGISPRRTFQPPKKVIDNTAAAATSYQQLFYPDMNMKYFMNISIGEYEAFNLPGGGIFSQRSTGNVDTTITLPMPDQMLDQQTADWIEENLLRDVFGTVGALVAAGGVMRGQSVAGAAPAIAAGAIGSAASIAVKLGGVTPNQFVTVLFSGPKYKQHTFSWTFSPKTPTEAEELRKILQIFNNRQAVGISAGGFLWSFPSIFWLKFCPDVGTFRHTYLYEFKPAVLVNMMVDYAGGHIPSFRRKDDITNGKNPPQSLRLSMQFLEIEYWVNGDYGTNPEEGRTANGRNPPLTTRTMLNNV